MTGPVRSLLRRFGKDRSGAIALLTGLMIVPLILAVGVFVDYSRSVIARQRLANAIDAAALAVGASADRNLTDAEIEKLAQDFFDADYPPEDRGPMAPLDVNVDGDVVTIVASGKVNTTLLQLAHIDEIDIAARTEITRKQNRIELVMALDTTGSMAGSKLTALKTASKGLVDDLLEDDDDADYVKIGLVPFSAAVNVGADKKNSGWIDLHAKSSLHAQDFRAGVNLFDLYTDITNRDWGGCVRARPAPYDGSDDEPNASTPNTLFVPYFAPDEPDDHKDYQSSYINSYLTDAYTIAAKPKKNDPNCSGQNTPDRRQRCSDKYKSASVSSTSKGPDFNCPVQAILPLTNDKDDIIDELEAMSAKGSTVVPEGLAWAWRVVSPGEPYTEGVDYDDEETIKAIVLLTDGENDINSCNLDPSGGDCKRHNHAVYNAFGYPTSGQLGATNGSQAEATLNSKLASLCGKVRNKKIRVYTIAFQVSKQVIKDLLKSCATEPSMYYNTTSGNDLKNVFADIAKGLNKLRISK